MVVSFLMGLLTYQMLGIVGWNYYLGSVMEALNVRAVKLSFGIRFWWHNVCARDNNHLPFSF